MSAEWRRTKERHRAALGRVLSQLQDELAWAKKNSDRMTLGALAVRDTSECVEAVGVALDLLAQARDPNPEHDFGDLL